MPAKGDKRIIKVNGQAIEAEFIGKGRFSTCYRVEDKVYSFTKNDAAKELINLFCNNNQHLPALNLLEDHGHICVYEMPFYFKLTKDNETAWKQYRALEKKWESIVFEWHRNSDWHKYKVQKFQDLVTASELPETLKDAIDQLCSNSYNYDRMLFEFSPRNLAVDTNENLILLDVLFQAPK